MLVKIQLCVNLLWYSNGIAIGPEFSSMQAGSENFVLMSRLGRKWHISSLAFMLFSWNHLKSLANAFCNFVSRLHWFFPTLQGVFPSD